MSGGMFEIQGSKEDLRNYYEALDREEQMMQFLINCLVCSMHGKLDKDVGMGFILALVNEGPPPFETFHDISAKASTYLAKHFEHVGIDNLALQ